MSTETPEPNVRAAFAYLSDAVDRFAEFSSLTLRHKLRVALLTAERGPQVAEYDLAGLCLFCGRRPPEDGYIACEDCNAKDYADV